MTEQDETQPTFWRRAAKFLRKPFVKKPSPMFESGKLESASKDSPEEESGAKPENVERNRAISPAPSWISTQRRSECCSATFTEFSQQLDADKQHQYSSGSEIELRARVGFNPFLYSNFDDPESDVIKSVPKYGVASGVSDKERRQVKMLSHISKLADAIFRNEKLIAKCKKLKCVEKEQNNENGHQISASDSFSQHPIAQQKPHYLHYSKSTHLQVQHRTTLCWLKCTQSNIALLSSSIRQEKNPSSV